MHNTKYICSIVAGDVYRHHKGNLYKILTLARNSENPAEIRVIYQGLYTCPTFGTQPIWDRPYKMFIENVVIDNIEQPRFTKVDQ